MTFMNDKTHILLSFALYHHFNLLSYFFVTMILRVYRHTRVIMTGIQGKKIPLNLGELLLETNMYSNLVMQIKG